MWFLPSFTNLGFMDFQIKNWWTQYPRITFLQENIKFYELKQVMCQNDLKFINILNRFRITSHISKDIVFINKICLRAPPIDNFATFILLKCQNNWT
jgi:hypothetical protein